MKTSQDRLTYWRAAMSSFYPTIEESRCLCISCFYAREREDICGIYCTTGFVKDGECKMFKEWEEESEEGD